jgi:hypothetical protein
MRTAPNPARAALVLALLALARADASNKEMVLAEESLIANLRADGVINPDAAAHVDIDWPGSVESDHVYLGYLSGPYSVEHDNDWQGMILHGDGSTETK